MWGFVGSGFRTRIGLSERLARAEPGCAVRVGVVQPSGVAAGGGVVAGVVVTAHLSRAGRLELRIRSKEAAGGGVVLAGAQVFQRRGRVRCAADIALVATGPGRGRGAAG